MMIAMHAGNCRERLAGVVRDVQPEPERIDGLVIFRIDPDLPEHPAVGARVLRHEAVRLRHLSPGGSAIVAPINFCTANSRFHDWTLVGIAFTFAWWRTRLVAVDKRIQDAWIRARDVDADASAVLRRG